MLSSTSRRNSACSRLKTHINDVAEKKDTGFNGKWKNVTA